MRRSYTVSLYVEVHDERELWEHARDHFCAENQPRVTPKDELDELFGDGIDPELPYNVEACLRQLTDPGQSWPGTSIQDSYAEEDGL